MHMMHILTECSTNKTYKRSSVDKERRSVPAGVMSWLVWLWSNSIGAVACPTLIPGVVHVVCPTPRLVEIRWKKKNESEISHSIMHALSARGRLRWFSFLPAVCLHVGLYVRCGAVLDRCGPIGSDVGRCGPILARWGPMGSDVVISRTDLRPWLTSYVSASVSVIHEKLFNFNAYIFVGCLSFVSRDFHYIVLRLPRLVPFL